MNPLTVTVHGAPVTFELGPLVAVGLDFDGQLKPLADLGYSLAADGRWRMLGDDVQPDVVIGPEGDPGDEDEGEELS